MLGFGLLVENFENLFSKDSLNGDDSVALLDASSLEFLSSGYSSSSDMSSVKIMKYKIIIT